MYDDIISIVREAEGMRRDMSVQVVLLALVTMMLCARPARALDDILTTTMHDARFSTLVKALQSAELVHKLSSQGPFTLFAPTDAAFGRLPAQGLHAILNNQAMLRSLLRYHVVSGKLLAAQVKNLRSLVTLQGGTLMITPRRAGPLINNARIITADIITSNGVIHVIDTVLLPRLSIAELIAVDGHFTTLQRMLQTANMTTLLNDSDPLTVFAPTDEAFAKLPPGTLDTLLQDIPRLTRLLEYHIAPEKVASVSKVPAVATFLGMPLTVSNTGNTVQINNARIINEIPAANGFIHTIDTVLIPPER